MEAVPEVACMLLGSTGVSGPVLLAVAVAGALGFGFDFLRGLIPAGGGGGAVG